MDAWTKEGREQPPLVLSASGLKRLRAGGLRRLRITATEDQATIAESRALQLRLSYDDGETVDARTSDCRAALIWLRAQSPARTLRSPGFRVEAQLGLVSRAGASLHDAVTRLCDSVNGAESLSLLAESLVGPFLTLSTESVSSAGGPDNVDSQWIVLDLRSGARASIVDVLDNKSLAAAVRAAPYVQRLALRARLQLRSNQSFASVRQQLTAVPGQEGFESFAFAGYDPARRLAELRLLFYGDPCSECTSPMQTLRLHVLVRPAYRAAFAAAQAGNGLFAGRTNVSLL